MGVVIALSGALAVLAGLAGYAIPAIYHAELRLPDHAPDHAPDYDNV
jgi:hypothetical protein